MFIDVVLAEDDTHIILGHHMRCLGYVTLVASVSRRQPRCLNRSKHIDLLSQLYHCFVLRRYHRCPLYRGDAPQVKVWVQECVHRFDCIVQACLGGAIDNDKLLSVLL